MNKRSIVASKRCLPSLILIVIGLCSHSAADGLANEYLLTQRWRELFQIHSPVGNPAYLTEADYIALRGAFAPTMQGTFKLWELGVTVPFGLHQAAGFTWLGEDDGEISESDFIIGEGFVSTGNKTSNNKNLFMLTYALNPWRRVSVGVNLNLAYETNFGQPVSGLGLDIGATYRLLYHPLLGDHLIGVSTLNLLAPAMSETTMPTFAREGAYSRGLKLSWYGRFWEGRIDGGLDFDLKDFFAHSDEFREWDYTDSSIVEAAKSLEWGLSFRLGAWVLRMFKAYLQMGFDDTGLDYWGLAAGFDIPTVNRGRSMSMLYQYNLKREEDKASTHTLYAYTELGRLREQRYARHLAKLLNLSPSTLYNRALDYYHKGQYWEAFFTFGQLQTQYPDFFKMDWVAYFMGHCQEELDMRQAAAERYRGMMRKYPASSALPHANLGLMRVYYRNKDLDGVEGQFRALSQPDTPDSLRYHAYYLWGEALAYKGRSGDAIDILLQIPYSHPDYLFARHSAALAYFAMGEDRNALLNLEECILGRARGEAQEEIINRSYALLGYYFYEEQKLSKAVTALREIPEESYYYEDALLGLGWCAVRAQQWADCIDMGRTLRQRTSHNVLKGEGVIVESYGYIQQKRYIEAAALLSSAYETIQALSVPDRDTLRVRSEQYGMTRVVYDSLAREADRYAHMEPVPATVSVIDGMHTRQRELFGDIEAFHDFRLSFGRRLYFTRTLEAVKADVEYLFAFAKRMTGEQKTLKEGLEVLQRQRDIDADIERLKKELETLEQGAQDAQE
ncbi:MAG: hypothetical protein GF331_22595 [Chitinivibrionales bacterium]|nr:hypothetical protein [Chitinivibrionales bacterium]